MTSSVSDEQSGRRGARSKKARPAAFADLWMRPGFLVRRLHQIHLGLFAEECGAFDVTPVQFAILTVLMNGEALDQVSLSAAVGIDRASGADVIRRLQRRALIVRVYSSSDRRAKPVQITAQGRALVRGMQTAMERAQARLVEPLSEGELIEFTRLMQKLVLANNGAGRAWMDTSRFSVEEAGPQ